MAVTVENETIIWYSPRTMIHQNATDNDALPLELQEVFDSLPEAERKEMARIPDKDTREFLLAARLTKAEIADDAKAKAKEFHELVVASTGNEQLGLFSPYPTEMTRCSPFFPLSTQEMSDAKRPYLKDLLIADHSWGQLIFSGLKLSVYDEDMLMILIAAVHENSRSNLPTNYAYKGSLSHLLKFRSPQKPGKNHLDEAYESYKRMSGCTFELITNPKGTKSKRGGKKSVNNIITNLDYDRELGILEATINEYFFEKFCGGEVTWIDIETRTKLKSPISKALHRFILSHQKDYWTGPLILLAKSLNLDPKLPKIKIRERLKKAINELVFFDVLQSNSQVQADSVTLFRVAKKPTKKLPEKKQ